MKIHHIFLILCFLPKFEACGESVTSENSCRIQKRETERINRGKNVMLGHHPWLVKIRFSDGATCTGTIVSEKFILTAKHCIKPRAAPKFIFYGHVHTSEMNTIKVKNHFYSGSDIRIKNGHIGTDLALLELVKPLKFSETVGPICLSKTGRMMENETAIIAGFGVAFSSAVFRGKPPSEFVVVPDHNIISFHVAEAQSNCVKHLPGSECKSVQESEFCAGGQNTGTATGDSGGPLMIYRNGRWIQSGITARGRLFIKKDAEQGYIIFDKGIYTDISKFCDWIEKTTKQNVLCSEN